MGYGDEIMATAEAAEMQRTDPRPVAVVGADGRIRWSPVFEGNPRLVHPGRPPPDFQTLRNHPGRRPYIARKTPERWHYTDWRVPGPGELYLDAGERSVGVLRDPYVLIEPHIKAQASPCKNWGGARWQALVEILVGEGIRVAQCDYGAPILVGAERIATSTFRHACGAVGNARLYVGPEGGMHHAAAALGRPAVVWFGGMLDPKNTGYSGHVNITVPGGPFPCGSRVHCEHCQACAEAVTPDMMAAHVRGALKCSQQS